MCNTPVKVLSIEAWRDESGWTWNNLQTIMELDSFNFDMTNRAVLKWLREQDILTDQSKGRVHISRIEGDRTIIEVQDHNTCEPLIAISDAH